MENPSKHLAYKYHIAKDLADILKEKNIKNINIEDKELALRLKFYGIEDGGVYKLTHSKFKKTDYEKIDIKYYDKIVKSFYLYR